MVYRKKSRHPKNPAYAVKSDDSKMKSKQYPAYALKSDDSNNEKPNNILLML
jgi:hypothetical protein